MFKNIIKKIIDFWIEFECLFVHQEKHNKKRVLLFRKDVLGDFIIFIPTLAPYREYYKDYEISLVVSSMSLGLSPAFPFIDKIIAFDQKKFRTNFWYRRNFIKNLVRKGFDVAIYPVWSREPIGDLIIKSTRANEKITFETTYKYNDYIYNKIIYIPDDLNEIDRNMAFVSKVTGKPQRVSFPTINSDLFNKKEAKILQEKNSLLNKKYCIVFPGAGATYKIWQMNKFARVSDYINEIGFTPVICGSASENKLAEEITRLANNKEIINLTGQTDIPKLIHLINDSAFYFGNDTGVLHLASALNIPSIAIMGGGHFKRFFPYGDENKNRIVFDVNMKCKMDDWKCSENLKAGETAPCIRNIPAESAKKEIDFVIKNL